MNRERILINKNAAIHTNKDTRRPNEDEPLDDRPRSVYEIVTRQMLQDLRSDLDEIKSRVNTLLWITAGAVILDFITKLIK